MRPFAMCTGKVIHFGVECDLCGAYAVIGDRYMCSICEDWDCCSACESQHNHPLIKSKKSSKKSSSSAEMMQKLSVKPEAEAGAEAQKQEQVVHKEEKQGMLEEATHVDPEQGAEMVLVSEVECGTQLLCVATKQTYVSGALWSFAPTRWVARAGRRSLFAADPAPSTSATTVTPTETSSTAHVDDSMQRGEANVHVRGVAPINVLCSALGYVVKNVFVSRLDFLTPSRL